MTLTLSRILRNLLFLFLFVSTISTFAQTEQISTWRFAENIGLRGVQMDLSGLLTGGATDRVYEQKVLSELYSNAELEQLDLASNNNLREFSLYAVLLPFRHFDNPRLRKVEWQTGLGLFTTPFLTSVQYKAVGDQLNRTAHTRRVYGKMRSFDYTNRLLFETKTIRNTFKLFAGPTGSISLIPSFLINGSKTSVEYIGSNSSFEQENNFSAQLARFSYSFGVVAGIKFSLSCRWNLGLAYQYHWRQLLLKQGVQNYSRNGFNVSLRYKFVRPDENGNPPDNINNGPFW